MTFENKFKYGLSKHIGFLTLTFAGFLASCEIGDANSPEGQKARELYDAMKNKMEVQVSPADLTTAGYPISPDVKNILSQNNVFEVDLQGETVLGQYNDGVSARSGSEKQNLDAFAKEYAFRNLITNGFSGETKSGVYTAENNKSDKMIPFRGVDASAYMTLFAEDGDNPLDKYDENTFMAPWWSQGENPYLAVQELSVAFYGGAGRSRIELKFSKFDPKNDTAYQKILNNVFEATTDTIDLSGIVANTPKELLAELRNRTKPEENTSGVLVNKDKSKKAEIHLKNAFFKKAGGGGSGANKWVRLRVK